MKTKHLLALLLLALLPLPLTADIRLPAIIGDNMVLQQQADVLLWGEASPRCNITLEPSWSQNVYTTRTDDDGNWKITLPTIAAARPKRRSFSRTSAGIVSSSISIASLIMFITS